MSLLMDALKRAERARQAEAERAKAEGREDDGPEPVSELSLDPMDDGPDEVRSGPQDVLPAVSPVPGTDTEDSLELTPPEVRREIEAMEDPLLGDTGELDTEVVSPAGAGGPGHDSAASLSLEYGDIPLDETGATLPSMRVAQRSVQDYFDGTHSMSLSMEEMQGAIAAGRPDGEGSDPEAGVRTSTMDGDTTSRRQAQAILDARAVAPSATGRNVALVLVLLLIVGGIGSAGFMFKDRLLALIDGESAIVVHRPPAARVSTPPEATAAAAQREPPQVLPADERDALLQAAEAAREEERRLAEAAQAQALLAATPAAAPPEAPAPETVEGAGETAPGMAEVAVKADDPGPGEMTQRVPLTEVMRDMNAASSGGSLSGFKISKGRRGSRTHAALVKAFDAFQRGDDGVAMRAYQKVLAREPRNRDAMLGAAAVMMRSGAVREAAQYYGEVLRINPRDAAAQAALIALQDDLDPVSGESHVKGLLRRAPRDANLHFTLGNLYSEQRRWPEAQQSYFDAYSLDNENPDYAFNLAVSLDRLAQEKSAAIYYRRAMELSQQRPAGFESAAAARRLVELGGS